MSRLPFDDDPPKAAPPPTIAVPPPAPEPPKPAAPARTILSVSELNATIRDLLENQLHTVWIEGELSGCRVWNTGHMYFNLKDSSSQVKGVMFRSALRYLKFKPEDGLKVVARGKISVYDPKGEYQLVCEHLEPEGLGARQLAFDQMKERLAAEGLFDADLKRPLPALPRRIGVITSSAGAALHDVLTALARRAPQVEVVVYPSPVQGAEAPPSLVNALRIANERAEVDLLLLVRGGGSLEDLWAFNDERVVRAVATSGLPVVCGVGHETDVTLCDLAADLRAPTPTAAAELAAPSRDGLLQRLEALERSLLRCLDHRLQSTAQRLDRLALRLARPSDVLARQRRLLDLLAQRAAAAPARRIELQRQRLDHLAPRPARALADLLRRQTARLDSLQARLQALDPHHVLARGYAWLDDGEGGAITSVHALLPGHEVRAVLADGSVDLRVLGVLPSPQG
jgi:exodeoxyribonuclease VII large subunit